MSFSRIRLPGLWLDATTVVGAEWETFDANQANAIDGDQGGVYSLQEDLIIGGAGGVGIEFTLHMDTADVAVHGTFQVDDSTFFNGETFFSDDVTFSGTNFNLNSPFLNFGNSSADLFTFEAHGTFEADVNFNGESFFNGDATFGGALDVSGGTHLTGFLNADGNCFLGNPGFVELLGSTTVRAPIAMADGGALGKRLFVMTDSDVTTRGPLNTDMVVVDDGPLTADRSFTILDTGAADGMVIKFATGNLSYDVPIRRPGGSIIFTLTRTPSADHFTEASVIRRSGTWERFGGVDA